MRQKLFFFSLLAVALLYFVPASAQYESILQPLRPEEQNLYKTLHVRMEKQEATGNTNLKVAENKIRLFSPEGNLLGQFTYHQRTYFLYDDQGRVSRAVDSTLIGENSFDVHHYSIAYNTDGKPLQLVNNKQWSTFSYDPASHKLTETLNSDSPAVNYYTYDDKERLVNMISLTKENAVLGRHIVHYTKGGLVYTECFVDNSSSLRDSLMFYSFYNDNKSLQSRQVFETRKEIMGNPSSSNPTVGIHSEAGIYDYKYDAQGRLQSIVFTSSANKIKNYTIEYTYNDKGLPLTEKRSYYHLDPLIIKYSYTYY